MESRINKLHAKYWAGETSLAEEAELKAYFKKNPSLSAEGRYWNALDQKQKVTPASAMKHPNTTSWKSKWSVAAAITVGLIAAILVIQDARNPHEFAVEDPKEAYEITRKALMMVSSGLNEGKIYSQEIANINKAQEKITETSKE
ncbi:hypothetical protein [Marinoscillum sp.]|uniref:hypothetical protein n=1 Tax=Marinoscillum sp. TaxID=2024838 RepID=UPI003BABEC10